MARLLSAASIFLAAFLLFQIQPIIARFVLPWYGGSAAVWGTCILFFQSLLFLGYVYAHCLTIGLTVRAQVLVHAGLLGLSLLVLSIVPDGKWKPAGDADPVFGILGLLTASVGLPYFLLSATSPLVQAWLVRVSPRVLPYRFYALSNLASLGALLAYPVFVERLWTLPTQASIWSALYAAFVLLCATLGLITAATPGVEAEAGAGSLAVDSRTTWSSCAAWLTLGALPSALSLAVTNHLTQNVASIPLLWIVPLGIYLLTLILCFDGDGWYRRGLFVPANVLAMAAAGYLLIQPDAHADLKLQLPVFSAMLFTACMCLHGELVRRKPAGGQLTHFYLWMALGGAVGGVSVGLGAPYLLRGYFELPIALSACSVAILLLEFRRNLVTDLMLGGLVVWILATSSAFVRSIESEAMVLDRNFYGGSRVIETETRADGRRRREMIHGAIVHGSQYLDASLRFEPTAYYARGSGIDMALQYFRPPNAQVGVIGLGAGTMAAYGRAGETWRYYELNPMVVEIARNDFTYLADSAAKVDVVLGDGRLSLEHESGTNFDVLAIDAFSGDSVPVHLLSKEAFSLYLEHLHRGGVLALHVSNDVLDLRPVVAAVAAALGKSAFEITVKPDSDKLRGPSTWVLVADEAEFIARPALMSAGARVLADPEFVPWTDDYSNLVAVLR